MSVHPIGIEAAKTAVKVCQYSSCAWEMLAQRIKSGAGEIRNFAQVWYDLGAWILAHPYSEVTMRRKGDTIEIDRKETERNQIVTG